MHTAPGDHRVQVWSQSSYLPARRSDFRSSTNVTFDLNLDLEHILDARPLETIVCKCGRDRAIFDSASA